MDVETTPRPTRVKRPPRVKGRKLKAGQRSLRHLRDLGYTAEVCEKYAARAAGKGQAAIFAGGFRKDLFGFADILAYNGVETIAVQTTSRQQVTAHVRAYRKDAEVSQRIRDWIRHPGRRLVLHGWECVEVPAKRGGTKAAWQLTERVIAAEDLAESAKGGGA
jgi:hypothetical protein